MSVHIHKTQNFYDNSICNNPNLLRIPQWIKDKMNCGNSYDKLQE